MLRLNKDTKDDLSLAVEEIDSLLKDIEDMKDDIKSETGENGKTVMKLIELMDSTLGFTERMNNIKQILIDNQD